MDTTGPLLETSDGKKYVFDVIDHYFKWCEACKEHDAYIAAQFLEVEIICRYGMPKYILTYNGSE
jgi:hypothetical protein